MDMMGIRLGANANDNLILGNRIEECRFGISISSSENNIIMNNLFVNGNTGISLYDSGNLIKNNTIDTHTFYGIRVNAHNNTITGNIIRNSSQSGIHFISSKYNVVNYNLITKNRIGISSENYVWEYHIHHNNIYSNIEYGLYADQDAEAILNATLNWWGHESGPHHPTENPSGKGDNISDKVEFLPWLVKEQEPEAEKNEKPLALIDIIAPNPAQEKVSVTFTGSGIDDGTITRYSWRSSHGGPLHNGTNSSFTVSNLSTGTHTIFLMIMDDQGVWSEEVAATLIIHPVSIANQPPYLTIQSPGNNTEVTGIITISGTVHDPEGDQTYVEISINGGEWFRINNATSWEYQYNTTQFEEGMNIISVRASDGQDYSGIKWLNITLKNQQDESDKDFPFPNPTQTAAGLVVISSFCLVGAVFLREDLRFAIISILAVPLYTKLGRDEILEQTNRQEIFTFLANNPGANYTRIKKELMLGTSTLVYHLNVLEREGMIQSRKEIGRRLFFLKQSKTKSIDETVDIPLSIIQKKIIEHLKGHNDQTMREIEESLFLKQQTISYNIRKLQERGLVIKSGGSRNAQYSIAEESPVEDENI